jgi:tRNA 2-thiouridine synthesizing protein D
MMPTKKISLAFMQPPYESTKAVTVYRLIDAALNRGIHVDVFAYEGAVAQAFRAQRAHANAVHGRDEAAENHPLPRQWVAELLALAHQRGVILNWVNCGLCVDERGVTDAIDGVKRGTPADFWKMVVGSDNTLVVGVH